MTNKTYKIYVLTHPDTREIRYVGVTTQADHMMRYWQHIHSAKTKRTKVAKWIYSLIQQGLKPDMDVVDICGESNWEEKEKYYIAKFNGLMNQLPGGKGVIVDRTQTSIQRSAKGHYRAVCQITDEGRLIKVWESTSIAAEALGLKSHSSIGNAIKNVAGCIYVKGTRWCYHDEYINGTFKLHENVRNEGLRNKTVYMFDLNNTLIDTAQNVESLVLVEG